MRILIEGVSGVGKTTLAKKLAEELGWRYVHGLYGSHEKKLVHPLVSFVFKQDSGIHSTIKAQIARKIRRHWEKLDVVPLSECRDPKQGVVVDGWYPSAYVYHSDASGDHLTFDASFLVVPSNQYHHDTLLYRTFFENNREQYNYRGEIPSCRIVRELDLLVDEILEEVDL